VPITTVRTFFPDVINPSQSTPFEVRGGDERLGVNIRMQPLAGARISGVVTSTIPLSEMNPSGLAAQAAAAGQNATRNASAAGGAGPTATLTVVPHDINILQDPNSGLSSNASLGSPDNGVFDFRNVPAGKYDVFAMVPDTKGWGPAQPPGRAATPFTYGRTTIDVGSRDLDGVRIVAHHGADLNGKITIDGSVHPSAANVRVSVQAADSAAKIAIYQNVGRFQPFVNADGTFLIPAVPEGQYRFQVTFGPPQPLGPVGPNSPVANLPPPPDPVAVLHSMRMLTSRIFGWGEPAFTTAA
jgi:hypothetical protein